MLQNILITIWLVGWVGLTAFVAAVIGNTDNVHGSGKADFPTFIVPLLFGWMWPVAFGLLILMAPFAWLSDRTTKRHARTGGKQ